MLLGELKSITREYVTVPYLETTKYINPEYIPGGMAHQLRKSGLLHVSQIHRHLQEGTLLTVQGIGDYWYEKIKNTFTYVDRRKVSQETADMHKALHGRAGLSEEKVRITETPLPPVYFTRKGNVCISDGHQGETTYSNPAMSRVGRKCKNCPATWEEDWSSR